MPIHDTLAKHRERLFGTDDSFAVETLRSLGRGTNPALAEKSAHALEYVAQLKAHGIRFVFVGGTAAQLLLTGGISRLSKDVDVMAPDSTADDWRRAVAAVAERLGGEIYQASEEQRDHGGLMIPALHFLIAYPNVVPTGAPRLPAVPADIELDVVLAPVRFATQETLLATHFYTTKEPLTATTPTVEALFGGKLTTLGPDTIGIPRGKANFDLATAKQLFDLSHLLAHVRDLGAVAQAYRAAYELQCTYHPEGQRPTLEAALDDALYTLKLLAAPAGAQGPGEFWTSDLAMLSQAAAKLRGYVGDREGFDRLATRRAAGEVALALAFVRRVLLDDLSTQEAQAQWLTQVAHVRDGARDEVALAAARARVQQVPWAERPHLNIREFVAAVGPEALLCWDAVFRALASP